MGKKVSQSLNLPWRMRKDEKPPFFFLPLLDFLEKDREGRQFGMGFFRREKCFDLSLEIFVPLDLEREDLFTCSGGQGAFFQISHRVLVQSAEEVFGTHK